MINWKKKKTSKEVKVKEPFDMSKGTIWSSFRKIWIPTLAVMVLGGTLVVFDSMFISMGFGPWRMFNNIGLNTSSNAYSALGAAGIASVQPYFLLIAAIGVMVGAGTAMKMTKAKAQNEGPLRYQKLLDSYIPKTIFIGLGMTIFIFIFSKGLIFIGSGGQKTYIENWNNSPLIMGGGFTSYSGGDWEVFFNNGGLDKVIEIYSGFNGTADNFITIWNENISQFTGGYTIQEGSYAYNEISKILGTDSSNSLAAIHLALSETPMAAGHVMDQSTRYLQIQALFAIPFMIASSSAFILRMEGKAYISTYLGIIMLVINLGLDFLFINVLGGNLVGAVIATGLAQLTSAVILYWYLKKKFPVKISGLRWGWAKKHIFTTIKLGLPTFAIQFASIILQWGTIFSMGIVNRGWTEFSIFTSAFQGFFSIYTLFFLIANGTIVSISPIVNYHEHRGDYEKVKTARNLGFSIIIVWSAIVTILGVFIPNKIAIVGTKDSNTTYFAIQWSFLAYIGGTLTLLLANWFQARNITKWPMFASFFKPAMIIPVSLALGFGMKNVDVTNMLFIIDNSAGVREGSAIFLAGPILDVLGAMIMSFPMVKDFKKLSSQQKK